MSKLIVAGGRDRHLDHNDELVLRDIIDQYRVTELVNGGAPGIDAGAARLWKLLGKQVDVSYFIADWGLHGRKAGPIRNREMAEYAGQSGICVLFPGGRGTASMYREARRVGMRIIDMRYERRPGPTAHSGSKP